MSTREHRLVLLRRCNFRCIACGIDLNKTKWHVDHVYPKSRGGPDDIWNLQILCAYCNISKRDRTMREWRPFLLDGDAPIHNWEQIGWTPPVVADDFNSSDLDSRHVYARQFGRRF